eukprot:CAMPEP_0196810090 /NCGR_PEP_ID=MMETSP1362-20130617/9929_1 /TAXON_ID=163516 /ORGANISM="Leptocylindrus danicus, Strain CCMP1856" /LENGTH=142 /DNA_ID=CAMNT_0042184957 /DNA_START=81 /DNA_END=513 /DNA_ORIENTATION=+
MSTDEQWYPPWFTGNTLGGAGFCPSQYWSDGANSLVAGMFVIVLAIGLQLYFQNNRLLVDAERVCLASAANMNMAEDDNENLFKNVVFLNDVEDFDVIVPVGMLLRCKDGQRAFFPLFWDGPSVQAVMDERLGREIEQKSMQ